MLDEDLAQLYGVETKRLNESVRHNLTRFPEDFMFRLSREEAYSLRSKISTLAGVRRGRYRKYWPYAFTEHGVAMLSSVLRSERAVEINIAIMRAFVRLRHALTADDGLAERMERAEAALEALEKEQGEQAVAIHEVFAAFRRLTGGG